MSRSMTFLAALGLLAGLGARPAEARSIRFIPASPANYTNLSSRSINLIVIHTIEGSEAGAIGWFRNPGAQVSAHYVVSHRGRITQMVRDEDKAWHCGPGNTSSIGIENEGFAGRNTWTQAQYEALAWLTRRLCNKHGIRKDRRHIVGHNQVPGNTHWDPGPHFNWAKFMRLVKQTVIKTRYAVKVSEARLTVRDKPSGKQFGEAQQGDGFIVNARNRANTWLRVWYRGKQGWILRDRTHRDRDVPVVVVNVNATYARRGPSSNDGKRARLERGQSYYRLGPDGAWWRIQLDGGEAFVASTRVREGKVR